MSARLSFSSEFRLNGKVTHEYWSRASTLPEAMRHVAGKLTDAKTPGLSAAVSAIFMEQLPRFIELATIPRFIELATIDLSTVQPSHAGLAEYRSELEAEIFVLQRMARAKFPNMAEVHRINAEIELLKAHLVEAKSFPESAFSAESIADVLGR